MGMLKLRITRKEIGICIVQNYWTCDNEKTTCGGRIESDKKVTSVISC